MRKIDKNAEPKEWTAYRRTPGAVYQSKPELRSSLLKEQGYICAYCMRRIPAKDANSNETTRIDHILCREKHEDRKLDYRNMVICCPGAIDCKFHCDKSKGNNDVSFNLFDQSFIDTLSYSTKDGTIKCGIEQYDTEINEILNLNHSLLKNNRKSTLKGVIQQLQKKRHWKATQIRNLLNHWNTKDRDGKYKPYNGIVVWYLKKKLGQVPV